jgi:rubrerythrin
MSKQTDDAPAIASVEELTVHAYAMEQEAAERYAELADAMAMHHQHEVATLFAKMAEVEAKHAKSIERRYGTAVTAARSPWNYKWADFEGPETVPVSATGIELTPRAALELARAAEQRALSYYESIRDAAVDKALRAVAADLAQEEMGHVQLLEQWLRRLPDEGEDTTAIDDPVVGH